MTSEPIQPGTHCTCCGYDLAGLQEMGTCPECAQKCTVTTKHYNSMSRKYEPYQTICRGLKRLLNSYTTLTITLLLTLLLTRITNDLPLFVSLVLFVALCVAALLLIIALLELATPFPKYSDPSTKSGFSKLVSTSLIGSVLSLLFIVPMLSLSSQIVTTALAYSALPGMLLVLIIGTAGIANNVTRHMGAPGLQTPLIAIVSIASTVMCLVFGSAYAFEYAGRNFKAKPLGLTGGQWQDIFILSVLALFVAHFFVTFAFWLKVRTRVKKLPSPTTTPTAP